MWRATRHDILSAPSMAERGGWARHVTPAGAFCSARPHHALVLVAASKMPYSQIFDSSTALSRMVGQPTFPISKKNRYAMCCQPASRACWPRVGHGRQQPPNAERLTGAVGVNLLNIGKRGVVACAWSQKALAVGGWLAGRSRQAGTQGIAHQALADSYHRGCTPSWYRCLQAGNAP